MEERHFPYPLGVKKIVQITEQEKKDIITALNAGWREFCENRHDLLGLQAKQCAGPAYQWDQLDDEDKQRRLAEAGIDVPVEWLEKGWPYHGIVAKLTKFAGQLTRCHYAVLTSGISEGRQAEIKKNLKPVEELDKKFLADAADVGNQIQRLMSNEPVPRTKAELVAKIESVVDKNYFVEKYMETALNKEAPTFSEFGVTFEVAPIPEPKPEEEPLPEIP